MKFVCLDVETTGVQIDKDRVIQFAAVKVDGNDMSTVIDKLNLYIKPSGPYSMSVTALAKHHITPEFLEDKPSFKDVSQIILDFIKDCSIIVYNGVRFDMRMLYSEFKRIGIEWDYITLPIYDVYREELKRHPNTLEGVYQRYMGKSMVDNGLTAHDAYSDCLATISIFDAQNKESEVEKFNILTPDGFIDIREFNGEECECFCVGKYSGVSVKYVASTDNSYIKWILNNPGFSEYLKKIVRKYVQFS